MREKSVIDSLLYGRFKTVYECLHCLELYILFEIFHAVYLPLPNRQGAISLEDCFDEFCKEDIMDGENAMSCDRCDEDQPTKKTMSLYSTASILIVSLKRFRDGGKDGRPV